MRDPDTYEAEDVEEFLRAVDLHLDHPQQLVTAFEPKLGMWRTQIFFDKDNAIVALSNDLERPDWVADDVIFKVNQ